MRSRRLCFAAVIVIGFVALPSGLCQNTDKLSIEHGPYLQAVTDSSVAIVWFTSKNCVSKVEYMPQGDRPFDGNEAKTAFSSNRGLIDANSRMHKITVTGLKPGVVYQYRIVSKEIAKFDAYTVAFGSTVTSGPYRMRTWNPQKAEFTFCVVNDIHEKTDVLKGLLKEVPWDRTDAMILNGDMVNHWSQEDQMFKGWLDACVEQFAKETPFVYVRGNHDTRGALARNLIDYFPTATGEFYYAFQHGPVSFLVLDSGEDKADSNKEYSGLVYFDAYRAKETEWLKKAVEDRSFQASLYRIVLVHMPLYGASGYGIKQIRDLWSPILNKANIDLTLSAHTHRFARIDPNESANRYPIIINAPDTLVTVDVLNDHLGVSVKKADGQVVDSLTLKPHRRQ
jgi:acid phosphatase type 7